MEANHPDTLKVNFSVSENDFVDLLFYVRTSSKAYKKSKVRMKFVYPVIFLILAVSFYYLGDMSLFFFLLISSIFLSFVYPVWEKMWHIKHLRKFVKEKYAKTIDKQIHLQLDNTTLYLQDAESESKFSISLLEKVCELPTLILLNISNAQWLALPKDKVEDVETVISRLKQLSASLNIPYIVEQK